jgi:hypothetical protein
MFVTVGSMFSRLGAGALPQPVSRVVARMADKSMKPPFLTTGVHLTGMVAFGFRSVFVGLIVIEVGKSCMMRKSNDHSFYFMFILHTYSKQAQNPRAAHDARDFGFSNLEHCGFHHS